jgi:hypothetical protein
MSSSTGTTGNVSRGMQADRTTMVERLIEALADKHSQLDINFQHTGIKFPGLRESLEVNGTITLSVHMRDLSDEEKRALSQKNVSMLAAPRTSFTD